MANSPNLTLPYIEASQAQKHVTHNDALLRLDAIVQLSVVSDTFDHPPDSPNAADGDRHIISGAGVGEWGGFSSGSIAAYQDGAWIEYVPMDGWLAWVEDSEKLLVYSNGAWVGPSIQTLDMLGINATATALTRLSVASNAILFNHDGSDMALNLNKSSAANNNEIYFQTGFSTRAIMGNSANDDFTIKVSPDGSSFFQAIVVDKDTGNVAIGTSSDVNNKLTVSGSSCLFSNGSGSFSFVFSKNAAADDASLTFQTNFSARALVGLLADDNLTFKVSPDGSSFFTGFTVDKDDGAVDHTEGSKFSYYTSFGKDYTAGSWHDLEFNTQRHNDQGDVSVDGSNVLTFTAPTAGYYLFGLGVVYEAGSAPTKMQIGLDVNASGTPLSDTLGTAGDATFVSGETSCNTTALLKLSAGDTVNPKIQFTTNTGRVLANEDYIWGVRIA